MLKDLGKKLSGLPGLVCSGLCKRALGGSRVGRVGVFEACCLGFGEFWWRRGSYLLAVDSTFQLLGFL